MIGHVEFLRLVDCLEQGVLVVTAQAVVMHLNRAAEALLRAGSIRRDVKGAVSCRRPEDTRRLRRAIGEVATAAGAERGLLLVVDRPAIGHPLSVRVVALGGGADGRPAVQRS